MRPSGGWVLLAATSLLLLDHLCIAQRRPKIGAEWNREEEEEGRPEEEGRHVSSETIKKFTETLGAINTLGSYLVNYTRGTDQKGSVAGGEELPGALYTLSKNLLGSNMTERMVPLVRVVAGAGVGSGAGAGCTRPGGGKGTCLDLSACPQLLLDLASLRESICFKSLFVPGVCCPADSSGGRPVGDSTSQRPPAPPLSPSAASPAYRPRPTQQQQQQLSGESCGVAEVAKFRVVGGEESLPGRWPWMAAVFLHGPRRTEFWCGGSLVTLGHVLTAAHCTRDNRQRPFSPRQLSVRLGDVDLGRSDEPSAPQRLGVREVRAHPRFSRVGFYNDIAVLVLSEAAQISRYVRPLCLPPPSLASASFAGRSPTVVGWGTTYYGGKESTVQRQADLPVWRNEDCDRTYFQRIDENFLCAGLRAGGKDACQGDSGGPLMLREGGRWTQIGIVSFGNKCGEPGYPGVYTRVTKYLDWIKANIGA